MEIKELPYQESMMTFGQKESYEYQGVYEVDTIKQAEMTSEEQQNFLKLRSAIEISSKASTPWQVPLYKIF